MGEGWGEGESRGAVPAGSIFVIPVVSHSSHSSGRSFCHSRGLLSGNPGLPLCHSRRADRVEIVFVPFVLSSGLVELSKDEVIFPLLQRGIEGDYKDIFKSSLPPFGKGEEKAISAETTKHIMREQAKIKIKDLVERFRSNLDVYKKTSYNETQLRREYLDPLFDALGWDVANKAGYAEQYKRRGARGRDKNRRIVKGP